MLIFVNIYKMIRNYYLYVLHYLNLMLNFVNFYKLIKNKTNITTNKNGIYFNLQSLDDETIDDLIDYLDDVL